MSRHQKFLNQNSKKVVIESFILANFNYCPLVWHFCTSESLKKLERIQERALWLLLNDYQSDYETLLEKSNKPTLQIRRIKLLATEIFKTINDLNPSYMKEIFELNTRKNAGTKKLVVQSQKSMNYGSYSLRSLGPRIWNKLPISIRNLNEPSTFKELITSWAGPTCRCSCCKYLGMC